MPRTAYNAFSGLAAKRLQMFPDEPVPRLPPTSAFLGDGIEVSVAPLPGRGEGVGGPAVTFSASGPNSEGVVTELILQRLAGKARKPTAKGYRTQGFVAFAAGALTAEVPCEPGAYAGAIRFVRAATGQETALVPIGKVIVP